MQLEASQLLMDLTEWLLNPQAEVSEVLMTDIQVESLFAFKVHCTQLQIQLIIINIDLNWRVNLRQSE